MFVSKLPPFVMALITISSLRYCAYFYIKRSMVGIPFKLLDKKIEKKLLFSRRKELISQLEEAEDAQSILELVVMILMQQTCGVTVCGEDIYDIVLNFMICQKKIPNEVSPSFVEVVHQLQNSDSVSANLIAMIRECGLAKDINEFTIQQFEL